MGWEIFECLARKYDRWYDANPRLFQKEVECLKKLVPKNAKMSLEIGVGTGRFAEKLGIKYGLDPSLNMLRLAKGRCANLIRGDGAQLPFKSSIFDCIMLIATLCYLDYPEKVLEEIRRVLKDNGFLIVCIFPAESRLGQEYIKKGEMGHPIYSLAKFYKLREAEELIERFGFKIEEIRSTKIFFSENDFTCIKARKI